MTLEALRDRLQGFVAALKPPDQISWLGGARIAAGAPLSPTDLGILCALSAVSVAVVALYLARGWLRPCLPRWLRPFAAEEPPVPLKRKAWTHWTLLLGFIAVAGLVAAMVPACLPPRQPVAILEAVPWLAAALLTALERPTKASRVLLLLYLLILAAGLAAYAAQFLDNSLRALDPYRLGRMLLCVSASVAIINMPLRNPAWDTEDIGNPKLPPSHHVRSPEDNLTLFRFWTVSWVFPLARIGRHKELGEQDVWQLPLEFQHMRLYMAFRELRGRLIPRLVEANGLDLCIATSLAIVQSVAEVSAIRLTARLYSALDGGREPEAVFWCVTMLAVDSMAQVCKTTSTWYSRKAYERSRGEAFIGLFGKLLTRAVPGSDVTEKGAPGDDDSSSSSSSSKNNNKDKDSSDSGNTGLGILARCCGGRKKPRDQHRQPASNAKVVNLVRGDTYEISQRFWDLPKLVSQPITVLVTMYYLVDIMGWPSCVGFGLMALFLSINSLLVRETIRLERQRTAHSDRRAQAVAHFVEASRPLKLNGWTAAWSARILRFRAREMAKRLQIACVGAAIQTVGVLGGTAYPLASICLYALVLGRGLPNDVIWPSLQLFARLEVGVREAFDLISAYWKATIPVERVNRYMDEPDRDDSASLASAGTGDIEFRDASFSWPGTDCTVLRGLNLRFPEGLTVVRGKVGSGKSSLLLAALNEMELRGGRLVRPDEPVGYAQQLPWLQSKTIRDNIVFHQPFDAARYRQVLHACALGPDLEALPAGDETRLDEGGVGLSGGQKARVALARAVYSPCRILLLDDPLSALDHDTARSIVRRLLRGSLAKGRTIVLVTHRDDLVLRLADQVVDMDDGRATVLSEDDVRRELEHPIHGLRAGLGAGPRPGSGYSTSDDGEHPLNADVDGPGVKDAPEEPGETGRIRLSVYLSYVRAGGWAMWLLLALFFGASRACDVARARLLEAWGDLTALKSGSSASHSYWGLPDPAQHPRAWIGVLAGLSAGQIAAFAAAQLLLAKISVDAAQRLFGTAIERVGRATFRYLDVTPTGQLKNRLIADMAMVDGGILAPLQAFVYSFIAFALSLAAVATHQPLLLLVLAAVGLLFVRFFLYYVPASRCLRRMEMRYLTPIIANIGVMQDGLVTIRALRVEGRFQDRHLEAVDDFQKQDHFFWSMAFWLDFRLGVSAATTRALLVAAMVWLRTPASAIGFVLTQTTTAMAAVQQLCERFAQLQLDAVSLERVNALNAIPEEPAAGDPPPADDWPRRSDAVRFDSVSFRYADGLPAVLDGVSFEIPGGASCAVLGRTGSGKSTIANALLATQTAASGTVSIGGVDLARVDRTALRQRITFIQQDPTLFPGTLRDNLDPEARFSDADCLRAIHRVLGPTWRLDSPVDAGGKNLSQGQRQLVAIGRAVLRRSGLVILDEATASIDRATAATVQRVLRAELAQSTVITIAHRLEAVEDADWCLRLERGVVVECGPAHNLRGAHGAAGGCGLGAQA